MEDKKSNEQLADEALSNVTGGDGNLAYGWTCAKCGKETFTAKAHDGKTYCIKCFKEEFPNIPV